MWLLVVLAAVQAGHTVYNRSIAHPITYPDCMFAQHAWHGATDHLSVESGCLSIGADLGCSLTKCVRASEPH